MEGFTQQSTYLTYLWVKFKLIETAHENLTMIENTPKHRYKLQLILNSNQKQKINNICTSYY